MVISIYNIYIYITYNTKDPLILPQGALAVLCMICSGKQVDLICSPVIAMQRNAVHVKCTSDHDAFYIIMF